MDRSEWISWDKKVYANQQTGIKAKLAGSTGILDHVGDDTKEEVFYMLMFCLLVPQSRQVLAEKAVEELKQQEFYSLPMSDSDMSALLRGKARFQNVKAKRLVAARKVFLETDFWASLKERYKSYSTSSGIVRNRILLATRNWLDSRIDGFGLKLSSHFLRNVGMKGLAILDNHVRVAMKERMGIGNPGDPLNRDEYYTMEQKFKEYADQVGISIDELDLLLCGLNK